MMHSRGGFVLSENQAYAGQTRTPGPSRLHASPTRKAMTTGKRALGESSKLFGQETGAAGPKQLFGDLMSSKSPVKALGDRNAAKMPGPSNQAPSKQNASNRKGKGSSTDASPGKKGSTELSPRKASTSNALRSINGKQRQTTDLPFTKPGQSSTDNATVNLMKTPAPSQLGSKPRGMSRQNSFVTPAANTGRAGQIKARMGEILDAEMSLSLQKGDNAIEQITEQPAAQMTEDEMYPEIEYMPPSFHAKHPVFEFPDELDNLPRGKELGAQLSVFSAIGIREAGPGDVSDEEIVPMPMLGLDDLAAPAFAGESDDDDPWPDVPVSQKAVTSKAVTTTTVRSATSAPTKTPSTLVRLSAASRTKAPAVTVGARASTAKAPVTGRTVPAKAPSQPAARVGGLQRSIASAPGGRALLSSSTTAARPTALPARSAVRSASSVPSSVAKVAPRIATSALKSNEKPLETVQPTVAMALNPKLIDFVDDDLGKHTAAALERMDAEENVEALQLDLDEPPADD